MRPMLRTPESQPRSNSRHVLDQLGSTAFALGHLDEAGGIGRIGRTDDDHQVAAMGDGANGVLAVLRGVADVVGARNAMSGNRAAGTR